MTSLDLTREEAVELWLADNEGELHPDQIALEEKAKTLPRDIRGSRKGEKRNYNRKVDSGKRDIISTTKTALEEMGAEITEIKTETELHFRLGDDEYYYKLVKKRRKN